MHMIVAVSSSNDRRVKPKVNVKLPTAGSEIGKITLKITQSEVGECHYLDITPKKMTPSISESRGYIAFRKPIYENKRCAATRGDKQRRAATHSDKLSIWMDCMVKTTFRHFSLRKGTVPYASSLLRNKYITASSYVDVRSRRRFRARRHRKNYM